MSKQTAVEWLEEKLKENLKHIVINGDYVLMESIFLQAKAMEREQIQKAARECHFEGVRQSAKTSEDYIIYGEQYYNETYGGEQ